MDTNNNLSVILRKLIVQAQDEALTNTEDVTMIDEAITAIMQLIKQARNSEIEALVTHIQDKFEEVEVLLNEYQYVRTRLIDKEGNDNE